MIFCWFLFLSSVSMKLPLPWFTLPWLCQEEPCAETAVGAARCESSPNSARRPHCGHCGRSIDGSIDGSIVTNRCLENWWEYDCLIMSNWDPNYVCLATLWGVGDTCRVVARSRMLFTASASTNQDLSGVRQRWKHHIGKTCPDCGHCGHCRHCGHCGHVIFVSSNVGGPPRDRFEQHLQRKDCKIPESPLEHLQAPAARL